MDHTFRKARDAFHREATYVVDMSERQFDELLNLLRRNGGTIDPLPPDSVFTRLEASEVKAIERIYKKLFLQKTEA